MREGPSALWRRPGRHQGREGESGGGGERGHPERADRGQEDPVVLRQDERIVQGRKALVQIRGLRGHRPFRRRLRVHLRTRRDHFRQVPRGEPAKSR